MSVHPSKYESQKRSASHSWIMSTLSWWWFCILNLCWLLEIICCTLKIHWSAVTVDHCSTGITSTWTPTPGRRLWFGGGMGDLVILEWRWKPWCRSAFAIFGDHQCEEADHPMFHIFLYYLLLTYFKVIITIFLISFILFILTPLHVMLPDRYWFCPTSLWLVRQRCSLALQRFLPAVGGVVSGRGVCCSMSITLLLNSLLDWLLVTAKSDDNDGPEWCELMLIVKLW